MVLSGIIYLGIYLLGYTKFSIVVLTFTTALGLVPMFIMKSYRGRMNILENRILDGLRSLEPFTAIALSLTVCFVFFLLAVQVKARRLAP